MSVTESNAKKAKKASHRATVRKEGAQSGVLVTALDKGADAQWSENSR